MVPVWIVQLFTWLVSSAAVRSIVTQILLAVGFGYVSYVGFGELAATGLARVQQYFGGFSGDILHLLGLAGVDYIINSTFAAYSAVAAMSVTKKLISK